MPKSDLRNNLMRSMIAPQAALENNPKAKLIPLDKVTSNPFQVRQDFDSPEALAALEELAGDIGQRGILQPLVVRPVKENRGGNFEIVAGERRYRAARMAGLKEVPAIVEEYSDEEARLVSLTENLQRRDLNFKEEVEFLAQLDAQRSLGGKGGDTDLAQLIHKSRTYVAKRLKLASHPELVERVAKGELSINQAYDKATGSGKNEQNTVGSSASVKDRASNGDLQAQENTVQSQFLKSRLVPFVRVRDAVARITQEIDNLPREARSQLKQEVEHLEQELAQLRSRL